MRDLLLACVVFGSLPFIMKRPFLGILMMAWLGYMNPHRLAWGFMVNMPVVQIVFMATLIGLLASKEAKRMVWSREIIVLVMLVVWMGITTTQALYFGAAIVQYEKVVKIQILTVLTLLLLTSRQRVDMLIWAIVLSLAFYGVKGGLFTIAKGGVYRVQGPPDTFIGGNNELALALVMTIPLMRYLQLQATRKVIKLGLTGAIILSAVAAFGTQSRGALVALICTGTIFWLKSRNKLVTAVMLVVAGVAGLSLMPEAWFERMSTIKTFDEDRSALGRISAWWTAFNLANDRFFGGGFELWKPAVFGRYSPTPNMVHDVHSIYFEMLGEHGWLGLILFLLLLALTWRKCSALIRFGREHREAAWVRDLGSMVQVSMVAYMTAGAFLGLAYFDYIYHLVAIVVVVYAMAVQGVGPYPQPVATSAGALPRASPGQI